MTPKEINEKNLGKATGGRTIVIGEGGPTILGDDKKRRKAREEGINRIIADGLYRCPSCRLNKKKQFDVTNIVSPEKVGLKCKNCGAEVFVEWDFFGL